MAAKSKSGAETEERFSKAQFLRSKKYSALTDFLKVLLEDGRTYTRAEAEKIIDGYMKGSVK